MNTFFLSKAVRVSIAVGIAAVFLASGCGESSGDSSGDEIAVETGSLTKAEFIEQADEICKESRADFERKVLKVLQSSGGIPTNDRATATAVVDTIYVPIYEERIDRISALGAPEGDEDEVVAFLEATQDSLKQASAKPLDAVGGAPLGEDASRLAKGYGLTVCAEA